MATFIQLGTAKVLVRSTADQARENTHGAREIHRFCQALGLNALRTFRGVRA